MAYGELNQGAGLDAIQSPGMELNASPPPDAMWVQQLVGSRNFVGLAPLWLGAFAGAAPPGSLPWLPSVAWRRRYRKRWGHLLVNVVNTNVGISYSGDHYTTGAGSCPAIINQPQEILWTPPGPPTYPLGDWTADDHECLGSWNVYFPGIFSAINGVPAWGYGKDLYGTRTDTTAHGDGYNLDYPETIDLELTTENLFAPILTALKNRTILDRSWPARATWPTGWVDYERFRDAWHSGSGASELTLTDPAIQDGSADTDLSQPVYGGFTNAQRLVDPWFGADTSHFIMSDMLWTGWYFQSLEESDGENSTANGIGKDNLWSKRTRFSIPAGVDYFIAQADLLAPPQYYNDTGEVSSRITALDDYQTLGNCVVIDELTNADTDPIEILWPDISTTGYNDFSDVTIPGGGGDHTLSFGCIRFVILGESPADWSARTGIAYS